MKYGISLQRKSIYDHWRDVAKYWKLSPKAKEKLEWMIFYYTVGKENAKYTANYFGISRKTFHKWKARFNSKVIQSLEEKSRKPKQKRKWTVTALEIKRVVILRRRSRCKWGKEKIKREYKRVYGKSLSTNKVQKIVNRFKLFPDFVERKKQVKRLRLKKIKPKTRIHNFKSLYPGTIIWHTDSVVINWYQTRRYIFTALEDRTKVAFARVYESASSRQATDFLKRLIYLTGEKIKVIHSDNGGEFRGEFEKACELMNIKQIYSRVRTPKDNPALERFNYTIQDEWLSVSEAGLDEVREANLDLTEWLIKYNFERPHYSLDYLTPIQYAMANYPEVLPMTPAHTNFCFVVL